jgi:uncharacterized protein
VSTDEQVMERRVPVPMRDGTVLRASVLRPARRGRYPTLVFRTPYGVEGALVHSRLFREAVSRGYAVVAQDVRGRYESDGEFEPYRGEGRDGYDTIEWAAAQRWSNGSVGSFGLSYPGAVQWLAALETPPALRAMVPAMTFSQADAFWYAGGLPDLSWLAWIWLYIAPEERRRRGLPGPRTLAEAEAQWPSLRERLHARLPITDVPEIEACAPWYIEWLRHPPGDPWWAWADLTGRYHQVRAAVYNISGWHDEHYGAWGALTNYLGLVAARGGDPRTRLVLGPWVHGIGPHDDPDRQERAGDRSFGVAARFSLDREVLRFMDRHLRGIEAGDDPPGVSVFVMGENHWLHGERWPLGDTAKQRLHLAVDGAGNGLLAARPANQEGALELISDPADPLHDPYAEALGAHDYRDLGDRPDTLVFETAPLSTGLRVVGRISVRLHVMSDAPALDLWVKLLDVAPDGTAWNLMSPGLDAVRLGNPPLAEDPLQADRVYAVELDRLLTGNRFAPGHRVRIVVMTSFMPHFSRNPQTGDWETHTATTRPARVRILFGPGHPSHMELPVLALADDGLPPERPDQRLATHRKTRQQNT